MVGFGSEYITGGSLYINTQDGYKLFCDELPVVTFNSADNAPEMDYPIRLNRTKEITMTCKLLYYNKDYFAQMMGYKNHNCYCRAIRRMKRKRKEFKKLQRKMKYAENT